MLRESDRPYIINHPIYHKYRLYFDFKRWVCIRYIRDIFINERIIEVPYVIQALSGLPKGSRVLDVGCSESVLPLNLACLGYQVIGYDYRFYPYPQPNLRFIKGDATQLPFQQERFSAVISVSTFEHLGIGFYGDPEMEAKADRIAVEEVLRVLQPEGLFVLTVPFGKAAITEHSRIYDKATLERLLSGFELADIRYFVFVPRKNGRLNFWEEVSETEAAGRESGAASECVCLIKAKKV